ncbi:XAC2610-related protein [Chryseobacterium sp. MIQD13]|uniref:XAC2610-related protein n=1 Tax=Chryseobacterium sp. MIQD13 TaxID=3422310 RepID=UPI003D2AF8A1
MNRTFLFLLIILGSCSKKAAPMKDNIVSEEKPVQEMENIQTDEDTASVPFSRSLKKNTFTFTLKGLERPNGSIDFKSITILDKKKIHQKIIVDTIYVLNEHEVIFNIDNDANFDGYNDLEVINWAGNYASSSSFWLYNQKSRKYDHYKPLDTIQNIKIDSKRKEIISDYHIGPSNTYSKTYQWEKGKLLIMSAHIVEEGDEINIYRKNGKIIVE